MFRSESIRIIHFYPFSQSIASFKTISSQRPQDCSILLLTALSLFMVLIFRYPLYELTFLLPFSALFQPFSIRYHYIISVTYLYYNLRNTGDGRNFMSCGEKQKSFQQFCTSSGSVIPFSSRENRASSSGYIGLLTIFAVLIYSPEHLRLKICVHE